MKISDFVDNIQEEVVDNNPVDLAEIEKTAELLEQLSEDDTLLDDLAKLAVLQDVVGQNKEEFEKRGWRMPVVGLGERSETQLKKLDILNAKKEKKLAQMAEEASDIKAETAKINRKAEAALNKAETGEGILSSAMPYVVGGTAGALGAGAYFKNRENKMLDEIAAYYNQQTKPTRK